MVTGRDGVHRHGIDGAPLGAVRCHHHVFPKASVFGVELRESPPWEPLPYVRFTALLIQRGRKTDMGTIGGTATLGWCTAPDCPVPGLQQLVEIAIGI